MKCPLSNYILEKDDADNEMLVTDCLKEECAWWDNSMEMCCKKSESFRLGVIFEQLARIQDKMPHAEQFKK